MWKAEDRLAVSRKTIAVDGVDEMPLNENRSTLLICSPVDLLLLADLPWPAENGPADFLRTGSHFKDVPAWERWGKHGKS
jgi:hypothetical protein